MSSATPARVIPPMLTGHIPIGMQSHVGHSISRALPLYVEISRNMLFRIDGIALVVLVTVIGVRMLFYWWSFAFHADRYRAREVVSTADLREVTTIPFIKVQWTTKGSLGSTEVILRGLRQLAELAGEDPEFYREFLSAEVVTENPEQANLIKELCASSPLGPPSCIVTPAFYRTAKGTQLKAKQLQYLVEKRRAGWNKKPGKTFIAHFDEDTMMVPTEFRKMIAHLSTTDKKILTGPIYYPLEYGQASKLARATESTRPITCWECRTVMENGMPLHIHGSNLVIEEEFENRLGWDFGMVNVSPSRWNPAWRLAKLLFRKMVTPRDVPYVAEDYMFGMAAFISEGREAFGWHGCVALEQPPFSFRSVFRQRFRWVFGQLQGMSVDIKLNEFKRLPWLLRMKVIWGTRYRIFTYASGSLVGLLSLAYMPFWLYVAYVRLEVGLGINIPWELAAWFCVVGLMWLGSTLVGAWLNVMDAGLSRPRRIAEVTRAIAITPFAGMMENTAAVKAVVSWACGFRNMEWKVTPSTKAADDVVNGRSAHDGQSLADSVVEAPMPWRSTIGQGRVASAAVLTVLAVATSAAYVLVPMLAAIQGLITGHRAVLEPTLIAGSIVVILLAAIGFALWRTTVSLPPDRVLTDRVLTMSGNDPVTTEAAADLVMINRMELLESVMAGRPETEGDLTEVFTAIKK